MGYVCPVCEDPQSDAEHLANHLAFTAMLGDDGHEAWLDDHAPDWADANPAELAPRVAEHADETDFPQVFEDTTEGGAGGHDRGHQHGHDHDHQHGRGGGHQHGRGGGAAGGNIDGAPGGVADPNDAFPDDGAVDPEDVLAEARELTRERRANAGDDADGNEGGADAENDDE